MAPRTRQERNARSSSFGMPSLVRGNASAAATQPTPWRSSTRTCDGSLRARLHAIRRTIGCKSPICSDWSEREAEPNRLDVHAFMGESPCVRRAIQKHRQIVVENRDQRVERTPLRILG
jgi:hypothetical protein